MIKTIVQKLTWKFCFKDIILVGSQPINTALAGAPEITQQDFRLKFPKWESITRVKKLAKQQRAEQRAIAKHLVHSRIALCQEPFEHIISKRNTPFLCILVLPQDLKLSPSRHNFQKPDKNQKNQENFQRFEIAVGREFLCYFGSYSER